jgi:methylase of polypeptide subunit release factors
VAGPDGTECHEAIIAGARGFLNSEGALLLEIGALQKQKVEEILRKEGYNRIAFRKDYAGLFRVAEARRS